MSLKMTSEKLPSNMTSIATTHLKTIKITYKNLFLLYLFLNGSFLVWNVVFWKCHIFTKYYQSLFSPNFMCTYYILFPGSPQACCCSSCGSIWKIIASSSSLLSVEIMSLMPQTLFHLRSCCFQMVFGEFKISGSSSGTQSHFELRAPLFMIVFLVEIENVLCLATVHIPSCHSASKIFKMCRTYTRIALGSKVKVKFRHFESMSFKIVLNTNNSTIIDTAWACDFRCQCCIWHTSHDVPTVDADMAPS